MNEPANLIEAPRNTETNAIISREKILMGESMLGERYLGDGQKGSPFFETAHGVFPDFGAAERFAMGHFRGIRWLIADRVTRANGKVTYDFLIKPRSSRRYED